MLIINIIIVLWSFFWTLKLSPLNLQNIIRGTDPRQALKAIINGTGSSMNLPKAPEVLISNTAKLSCNKLIIELFFCIKPFYKILPNLFWVDALLKVYWQSHYW